METNTASFEDRKRLILEGLGEEERLLTVANYLEFISDGSPYLPHRTITPSEEQGLFVRDERDVRLFGAGLIQQAAIILRLPVESCTVAQTIYHRFYYRTSF